ncbi:MAG: LysM peptidoglycan-binding domain-containing protein [Oscillospiraceae bacterium]|jgi:uncharacterized FlgJ-related protein|nr:LysM peptidoglycan-binding domain-containing protein [Oscillospiraceae bacterium]
MTTQQENFISTVALLAQEGWNKWKVLPSLTLAQAIIECNWGKSGLTKTANALQPSASFWKIAAEQLGNGGKYKELAEFNGLAPESVIVLGQTLKILGK